MKKIILDCAAVETDDDFWSLYCKAVQPEGSNIFGRNLEAYGMRCLLAAQAGLDRVKLNS
ncbi:hypothetical protein RJO15_11715 [Herbaspirillum huttiense F1]|uniref:hypothetical protein n=1 Tax=Herbaspirillum sp. 1173 TaxID=2817734 RepID=UPI0010663378|nr:hypothetical protein [Herbaspirillum sp. 1173]MDR6739950.1 hypothetical protein [Herbaspirillum sp. 1173]MDT0356442.1 hypothetical protein [Herbaspirillum huttiense F1]